MIRVVLDTNVVVSAAINRRGFEAQALDLVVARKAVLFVSQPILDEYRNVLLRPRLRLGPMTAGLLLKLISEIAVPVTPVRKVTVSPDPDDNRFLECAEAAAAHFLVTGNLRHFPDSWKSTRLVNARRFVEVLIDAEKGHRRDNI